MTSFVYFEDDQLSRRVMELLLKKKLGYTDVTIMEDSTDYLTKMLSLSYKPDIIFVDIHMQPYNGFQVLAGIRASETLLGSKIVALTASVMSEEVKLLREAGFDGVIGKPIDASAFPELLSRILEGQKVWRPT
jgi:two-component system cell cycle response regulator DivK